MAANDMPYDMAKVVLLVRESQDRAAFGQIIT